MAQVTGAYSIAGRDLRALLALLRPSSDGERVPRHSGLLLRTLGAMAAHSGPAAFFDFGDGGAGIMRSTPLRCELDNCTQTRQMHYHMTCKSLSLCRDS